MKKDKPAKPFRVPPGLRMVRVNPTTGEPAEFGDRKAIWEAYLPGTDPQPGVPQPVLDGSGQTGGSGAWREAVLPGVDYGAQSGAGATGDETGTAPAAGGAPLLSAPPAAAPPRTGAPATEGTGGIY